MSKKNDTTSYTPNMQDYGIPIAELKVMFTALNKQVEKIDQTTTATKEAVDYLKEEMHNNFVKKEQIQDIKKEIDDMKKEMVTKVEFSPTQKISYGLIGVVVLAVLAAVLNLVIKG